MLADCPSCGAKVDAVVLHAYEYWTPDEGPPAEFSFARCPVCSNPFLLVREDYGGGFDQDDEPVRLYPPRDRPVHPSFPTKVADAFQEAHACLKNKTYVAAIIMCRKTLEALCAEHGVRRGTLAASLKSMKDQNLIEQRLFEWAEELRLAGNEAAHEVGVSVSAQDATDVYEFTDALLQYVYTFRDRFKEFKDRRRKAREAGDGDR